MTEETCPMLGAAIASRQVGGATVEIRRCNHFQKSCTVADHRIYVPDGLMQTCAGCPAKAMLMAQPEPPVPMSALERITTALKVMADTARTGMADEETIKARLAICQTCPYFENNGCRLCGCAVVRERNLVNKLAHFTSVCADKSNPRW